MYDNEQRAFIALAGRTKICLAAKMANRHGLITGATGTGKTVTLQTLAETFSQMGVPVFATDIKGDLSGVAAGGGNKPGVVERVEALGLADEGFAFRAFPVQFWDVFGEAGIPARVALGDLGPLLLSRLLDLNDTQTAVLSVVFKIAGDESLDLVDLKDLRKILAYAADSADTYAANYGAMSAASLAAIQRGVTALENDGVAVLFGEPALNIDDLIRTEDGRGVINILAADKLMRSPRAYAAFLLWLLTRLFDVLPEAGDPDKPGLVFFFDEAHLLFADAPRALVEKVEQVARLIRSKGVGVFFISQSPADMPDSVLGQLGNRVQHALRAYTPKEQAALKAAARAFRPNPAFDTETAIAELGAGEALVSFLDGKGVPQPVERALILPPQGHIGPLDQAARAAMIASSPLRRRYGEGRDRVSAYEILGERQEQAARAEEDEARRRDEAKAEALRRKEEDRRRKEEAKAEAQRLKEEARIRLAEAKEAERKAREQSRFLAGIGKSLLVPLARGVLRALFTKR